MCALKVMKMDKRPINKREKEIAIEYLEKEQNNAKADILNCITKENGNICKKVALYHAIDDVLKIIKKGD